MKKSLLLLFFSLSFTQIIAQSSVILPNGNVIPSFTLANRPATNQTVGQLIYQTDGTSGLYVWSGTAWTAVSAGSSGSGTVTNVAASSPISVVNGTTTPTLSISQANSTTNGFLSTADWNSFNNKQNALSNANATTNGILTSADWNTFSNKGSFNLPSLTDGSVLFSDGTTISQNNSSLKWNNSLRRLDIKGLNDGTIGAGFTNWISTSIGGSGGNRIVAGVQNGEATIGAHNETLSGWSKLVINPAGPTAVGSLVGVGNRMVVANAEGELSTQAIPTGNVGTVTNVVGTSPISVTNGLSTPTIAISQANSVTNGFLSSTDWNIFNGKQNTLPNSNGSTSGILTSTDWNTFNTKFSLPSLTDGSIVFSNGLNLSQNSTNLFWENTNARLGIGTNTPNAKLTVSSTNAGSGTIDWIAGNFGGTVGDRVVMGNINGKATIAAHNNNLAGYSELVINPGGVTNVANSLGINNLSAPQGVLDVALTTNIYTGTFTKPPTVMRGCNAVSNFNPYNCDYPFDGNLNTFVQANNNSNLDGALKITPYYVIVGHTNVQKIIRKYRVYIKSIFPASGTITINARIQLFGFNNDGGRTLLDDFNTSGNLIDVSRTINNTTPYDAYEVVLPYSGFSNTSSYPNDPPWVNEVEFFEESSQPSFNSGAFTVKADGKVGVGTNTPTANLDVVGNIRFRNGALANSFLVSDANGNASWSNTIGNLQVGNLQSSSLGIGTPSSGNNKLIVNGIGGAKINSTNNSTGTSDWIAFNAGGTLGDRVVAGVLNGKATIGAHNSELTAWSNLAINNGGGIVTIGGDATTPASLANGAHGRPLSVNGSIRQGFYIVPVTVPANGVSYVTWTHNLGYGPILMMSTDQNGGGNNMDYVVVTTLNNNANESVFVLRNHGGTTANGALRWILVW
ncbi:hypothetical protein EGI26_15750 [Lacihabitans sp. CCS-44]|uniref:beta strand repeat-containing protein n=1 Tax=Lacihabitans sp. CCS-44 TaxID=2487331 RepID=UPI0020CC3DAE|nr:hypothetical protein [Lacihabitans sp. CCS-44]MCP9756619.1 hypothetical protein [Lacihabitans sp. CCS-44]